MDLLIFVQGMDYAALKFVDTKEEGVVLQYVTCEKAEKGKAMIFAATSAPLTF